MSRIRPCGFTCEKTSGTRLHNQIHSNKKQWSSNSLVWTFRDCLRRKRPAMNNDCHNRNIFSPLSPTMTKVANVINDNLISRCRKSCPIDVRVVRLRIQSQSIE